VTEAPPRRTQQQPRKGGVSEYAGALSAVPKNAHGRQLSAAGSPHPEADTVLSMRGIRTIVKQKRDGAEATGCARLHAAFAKSLAERSPPTSILRNILRTASAAPHSFFASVPAARKCKKRMRRPVANTDVGTSAPTMEGDRRGRIGGESRGMSRQMPSRNTWEHARNIWEHARNIWEGPVIFFV